MAKIKICKWENCKDAATTDKYCRLHYMMNWKKDREEKREKAARRLNKYIDRMSKRYPDRYVDEIKRELRSGRLSGEMEERFGFEGGDERLFDDATYNEEVDNILRDLKVHKDY